MLESPLQNLRRQSHQVPLFSPCKSDKLPYHALSTTQCTVRGKCGVYHRVGSQLYLRLKNWPSICSMWCRAPSPCLTPALAFAKGSSSPPASCFLFAPYFVYCCDSSHRTWQRCLLWWMPARSSWRTSRSKWWTPLVCRPRGWILIRWALLLTPSSSLR